MLCRMYLQPVPPPLPLIMWVLPRGYYQRAIEDYTVTRKPIHLLVKSITAPEYNRSVQKIDVQQYSISGPSELGSSDYNIKVHAISQKRVTVDVG